VFTTDHRETETAWVNMITTDDAEIDDESLAPVTLETEKYDGVGNKRSITDRPANSYAAE